MSIVIISSGYRNNHLSLSRIEMKLSNYPFDHLLTFASFYDGVGEQVVIT